MKRMMELLTGFIICMTLEGMMTVSQEAQVTNGDFIIQDKDLYSFRDK